jgi:hypothetical protein
MANSRNGSIGGVNVPSWHKNPEIDVFENMTAFSPPYGDSFFKIQVPNVQKNVTSVYNSRFDTISEDQHVDQFEKPTPKVEKSQKQQRVKPNHLDHLESCKKYIINKETIIKGQPKSSGTDDGFQDAVCGSNLLKVAEKVLTNKQFVTADIEDSEPFQISSLDDQGELDYHQNSYQRRRGSRSLPASPKFERKSFVNPYFTITKQEDTKRGDISLLTSLFGITARKDITASQTSMASHKDDVPSISGSKTHISATNSVADKDTKPGFFKAKPNPSELREMNFWSPTSM